MEAKETVFEDSQASCDPAMSRSQFLQKLVRNATAVGALAIAPAVIDKFIAPAAAATVSGGGPVTLP